MAVKLRTRLFLVVAALVGASITASALLSRRATLVEVRELVKKEAPAQAVEASLERVAAAIDGQDAARMRDLLVPLEEETHSRIMVFDAKGAMVAASSPALETARIEELTPAGAFRAVVDFGGAESTVAMKGAPTRAIDDASGRRLWIMLLPGLEGPSVGDATVSAMPGWVWTTVATVVVAVPLVFAVSRRILGPITAITSAARRMQHGDLGVRVEERGGDELGDLARAFNAMSSRIAETERLRKQMVSDVAHELRSPVTNLRCTLESIQDGLVQPDGEAINALHEETVFLQRLIADLQELALAEAGQLALHLADVDLREVIRRAVASVSGSGPGAAIGATVAGDLPAVRGDADRLEQVLRNLLANARTHTPADGRIQVSASRADGGVRLEVSDTGSGIAAEHLPHVFDRFYRADQSRARATGGAGLGLAIARQLVEAHGGRITVASDGQGRGSRFVLTLPAWQGDGAAAS